MLVASGLLIELSPEPSVAHRRALGTKGGSEPRQEGWAWLRLALGLGQMLGAVLAFILLYSEGISPRSLAVSVETCLLTMVSVMIFGRAPWRTGRGERCKSGIGWSTSFGRT